MLLSYSFDKSEYSISIQWSADTGRSTVFRDIVRQIDDRHQFCLSHHHEMAARLDELTDKLYEQFYILTDEYSGVPYNPQMRRIILRAYRNVRAGIRDFKRQGDCEYTRLLLGLFVPVMKNLRKTARVYLHDHAYQTKYRGRLRDKEQYIETTPEHLLSTEFEDALLQMMDIAHLLDCLTEVQRRRLVKRIFLRHTLQEIADQECVSPVMVHKSVAAALKKLKDKMT